MRFILHSFLILLLSSALAFAESQEESYPGITDPFGDPATYEFEQDEKDDKEFFHLGRFLMIGFDGGLGIFTGGLGRSTEPGTYFGGRVVYFFDRSLAFEAAVHFANHLDAPDPTINIDTDLMPITFGLRFYFDTKKAPRAIALANPYIAGGGGAYLRTQRLLNAVGDDGDAGHFGVYLGGGVEFPIYQRHIYLGLDLRYHMVFFNDEDDTLDNRVLEGDRAGDYFTPVISITYSF